MKRYLFGLAMLIAVHASAATSAEEAGKETGPRPVVSLVVSPEARAERGFVGSVVAKTEIALGFPLAGTMAARPVDVGDFVDQGDVVARLDPEDFASEVRAAEAAKVVAEVNLGSAKKARDRAKALAGRGVNAETRLEDAERALAAAQARFDQAEASLEAARKTLSDATLTAPQDGVITEVFVEPGATVSAGQPVITLADAVSREVVIDLSEEDIGRVGPGSEMTVELMVNPDIVTTATFVRIESSAEKRTRTRRLHLALEDSAPQGFRLGALVFVAPVPTTDAVLQIPESAILDVDSRPRVWLVEPGARTVKLRNIELGATAGAFRHVIDGLKAGDEIVLKGIHSLEEGQKVGPQVSLP